MDLKSFWSVHPALPMPNAVAAWRCIAVRITLILCHPSPRYRTLGFEYWRICAPILQGMSAHAKFHLCAAKIAALSGVPTH